MATAFAPDLSTPIPPLARAAPKLALAASAGTAALAQALAPAPRPFAAAEAEFWRLSAIEETIDGDTDAAGAEAAAKNTNAALRALLDIPATNFADAAVKVEAIRAVYDVQAVPCLAEALAELATFTRSDPDLDAALVAAWKAWRIASKAIEDNGPDAPEATDAPHWRAREQAERTLVSTRPATTAGALAKLRFALGHEVDQSWAYLALVSSDDATLFARAGELDHQARIMVDAIAALVTSTDTTVRDAFEAWVSARYSYDASDEGEGGDDGPLYREIIRAERALADLPARTADDILYKLMPLALHEHGPDLYDNTFSIRWSPSIPGTDYLEDRMWRGLIESMLALSPRIREVTAMPHPRPPAGHPDMTLPEDGVPVDQMTDWLDRLVGDGPRYAKLWLRLMDASKCEVFLHSAGDVEQLCIGSTGFSPDYLAAEQALNAHLHSSGHRGAVVARLKEAGRVFALQPSEQVAG